MERVVSTSIALFTCTVLVTTTRSIHKTSVHKENVLIN